MIISANLTFLYQIVYDPRERKMKPLNPYESDVQSTDLSFAGDLISDEQQAFDFAIGNLNISGKKLEKVSDFDPVKAPIVETSCYGERATHSSIWNINKLDTKKEALNRKADEARLKIQSCFSAAPNTKDRASQVIVEKIKDSTAKKDPHISVVSLKSKVIEPTVYISKYFKTKQGSDEEPQAIEGNEDNRNTTDKKMEVDTEDIIDMYENKPKSIVKTPISTQSETITSSAEAHDSKYTYQFRNKEDKITDDEKENQDIIKPELKRKIHFSPHNNSCESSDKKKRKSGEASGAIGEWFDQLEKDTALVETKIIYNTQTMNKNETDEIKAKIDSDDCNILSKTSRNKINLKLAKGPLTNSPASGNAFKPVLGNKINVNAVKTALDDGFPNNISDFSDIEKTRKRNPFAKALNKSPKKTEKMFEKTSFTERPYSAAPDEDSDFTALQTNIIQNIDLESISPIRKSNRYIFTMFNKDFLPI